MSKSKGIFKDPYVSPKVQAFRALFSRGTGAVLVSAAATRWLTPFLRSGWLPIPSSVLDRRLQLTAGTAIVGFGIGYGLMSGVHWLRIMAIRSLLSYHGWLFNQKAKSTKLWGVLLKLLVGPGPHGLHDFEDVMPFLPVPELKDTCDKYLVAVKPLLTPEEFEKTQRLVEDLLANDGPKLQQYILTKAKKTKNWLADWWMTDNYHSKREPIALNVNFYMMGAVLPEVSQNSLARAAIMIFHTLEYYEMIQKGTLPPDMVMNMIPTCMDGVRFMLASTRIPGEHMDTLVLSPESTHIVIISKGVYYKMEMYQPDSKGKKRCLNKHEIKNQLMMIQHETRDVHDILPIGSLTTLNRAKWAKGRLKLMERNADRLKAVESSIFIVVLGDTKPQTISDKAKFSLTGDGFNRWFDKSLVLETWKDCAQGGGNMEHSGTDATHFAVMWEHVLQLEKYGPDGDLMPLKKDQTVRTDLTPPQRLVWDLDEEMVTMVNDAYQSFCGRWEEMDLIVMHSEFGRTWMKSRRVSPDGFIQMAIQLTFWRLHGCLTKTYEPASHRLFALGRTDNINPVSEESIAFIEAMESPSATIEDRVRALKEAIAFQNTERLAATAGYGCDRHMLGLLCAAREMGMDIPQVFNDKAFSLPMRLSTSQVPTTLGHLGLDLVPESILGGFGPACDNGYGVLYCSVGDNMFNFSISSWKNIVDTDSTRFGSGLKQAMRELRELLDGKDTRTKKKMDTASESNL